jgi:large-conductance mechanosensitive channel
MNLTTIKNIENSTFIYFISHGLSIGSSYLWLISNIVYFLILVFLKDVKKVSLFQIHHINMIGFFQNALVIAWSFYKNEKYYETSSLCYISEILWGTLKFVRAYLVLILALYRYFAVKKPTFYKKVHTSFKYAIVTGSIPWLTSFCIFFISKYSIKSTSGYMCLDGNGNDMQVIITYFVISNTLGFLLPALSVIFLYIKIINELSKRKQMRQRPSHLALSIYHHEQPSTDASHPHNSHNLIVNNKINQKNYFHANNNKGHHNKREQSLALQLILINSLEIISSILISVLTLPPSTFDNFANYFLITNFLDAFNNFFLSLIPIITIYFFVRKKHH